MKSLNMIEKRMVVLTLVLLVVLLAKSLWLDAYTPANASEEAVMAYFEEGEVLSINPLTYQRIVDLIPMNPEEVSGYDAELKFDYRIKVRWYLLGILPYYEISQYVEE